MRATIASYNGDQALICTSEWELHEYDGHTNWLIWYRKSEDGDMRDCDMRLILRLLDDLAEGEALGVPS